MGMRIIAFSNLRDYGAKHPAAKVALTRWHAVMKASTFASMSEVQSTFPKAKVLNADRVRFPVSGGNYRLIAAFDFGRQIVFVKFLGTHAEYDTVDALTVSMY